MSIGLYINPGISPLASENRLFAPPAQKARSDERVAPRKNEKSNPYGLLRSLEVTAGFEPADNGVADRGLTTWLRHHIGADYGARTRHLDLGKVALYQMS